MTAVTLEVWICPNEGCGNYYASSSMAGRDLTQEWNTNLKGEKTHCRAQCPNPSCKGTNRRMRKVTVKV